jgi:hypothetical protein
MDVADIVGGGCSGWRRRSTAAGCVVDGGGEINVDGGGEINVDGDGDNDGG